MPPDPRKTGGRHSPAPAPDIATNALSNATENDLEHATEGAAVVVLADVRRRREHDRVARLGAGVLERAVRDDVDPATLEQQLRLVLSIMKDATA